MANVLSYNCNLIVAKIVVPQKIVVTIFIEVLYKKYEGD